MFVVGPRLSVTKEADMTAHKDNTDVTDKPNSARIYDYLLGGHHNFAQDRAVADRMTAIYPDAPLAARANRAFLRRCITWCVEQGISQFLDIGSGIPTVGNVHVVARRANPDARVVYVDSDPVAVQYSQDILQHERTTIAIQGDARQPERMLHHPDVQHALDFSKPVAVLLVTVLHFLTDDAQALQTVQTLREALAPGSYLALSHLTLDNAPADVVAQLETLYAGSNNPLKYRSHAAVARFFDQLELVEPGLVSLPRWHPDSPNDVFYEQPERSLLLAGVGKKV